MKLFFGVDVEVEHADGKMTAVTLLKMKPSRQRKLGQRLKPRRRLPRKRRKVRKLRRRPKQRRHGKEKGCGGREES